MPSWNKSCNGISIPTRDVYKRQVIDRAVKAIYRPYLASPCPENMPILSALHDGVFTLAEVQSEIEINT